MKRNVTLDLQDGNLPDRISVFERKIKQVMFNLLSNAVKFTPTGGKIRTFAEKVNGDRNAAEKNEDIEARKIKIAVSDTGIGIEPEDMERIFNPFGQVETSTSRKYQGTGLGLSLTRRLVELHGGRIWAESRGKDCGTIVRFLLPY